MNGGFNSALEDVQTWDIHFIILPCYILQNFLPDLSGDLLGPHDDVCLVTGSHKPDVFILR